MFICAVMWGTETEAPGLGKAEGFVAFLPASTNPRVSQSGPVGVFVRWIEVSLLMCSFFVFVQKKNMDECLYLTFMNF